MAPWAFPTPEAIAARRNPIPPGRVLHEPRASLRTSPLASVRRDMIPSGPVTPGRGPPAPPPLAWTRKAER